ncbi:hypothetical protein LCGC14_1992570 [marine sediment metagenome]|uniref:Uncharacterized protein n=1 Tax=marine sediment metagenome TaxID=412755 RepID=A0A0F9F5E5_9ZZZZ
MHISFIPYGERSCVERMLRDMEAQKHLMPMTKGKKKQGVWMPGQIRHLPFGVYEYVFCKESLDMVLRTFNATKFGTHGINYQRLVYPFLRKVLKLKPIPKYEEKGDVFLWSKIFVGTIVLGIREDGELKGKYIDDKGWLHEAL